MILCVGCGALPEGDINVDAYPEDRGQCHYEWNPKETRGFVLADASHLPFKDGVFTEVRARHCIEHIDAPIQAISEWGRVCSGKVRVWTMSQWQRDLTETHIYAWSPFEFRNLMKRVFRDVRVEYTSRVYGFAERHHVKTVIVNLITRVFGFYTEIYGEASN